MKYLENDKLDLLIKLSFCDYKWPEVEEFKNLDDSNVVLSNRYYAKKKRIINKYKRRPAVMKFKKVMSVVSAACFVIVLSLGISVVSVSSLRNAVWNAIVEWYEDFITVRYGVGDDDYLQDSRAVAVTPPISIETVKKPTYLPEGVEEKVVSEGKIKVLFQYFDNNNYAFSYAQTILKEKDKYFDNETVRIKEINVDQNKYLLIEYVDKSEKILLWDDKTYIYEIMFSGDNLDEMIKIAQSVE